MEFVYDVVAYPGAPFAQTHPNRLATLATLFGLQPAPVQRCRVLELGCTDGGNLLPMALTLPESQFVGIDLAGSAIARGQAQARELGLGNVELHACDLRQVDASWGQFDYIIAHGVYSWVPAAVRDHVLKVSQENLAPQGVAYVSYNAHPGGHLRKMLREMMLFHVRGVSEPGERIRQARELMVLLASSAPKTVDAYRALVASELEQILERDPNVLFHDELAETYEPVFFHDFMAHAGAHGLQFLSEANYHDMQDTNFSQQAGQILQALCGTDRIAHEQYRDFLKCRKFRQTLLCHQEIALQTDVPASRVQGFYVASPATEVNREPVDGEEPAREFQGPFGSALKTLHPLANALMTWLIAAWPQPVHFEVLAARAGAENLDALREIVFATYSAGLVELHSMPPAFTTAVSDRPLASPLARWQARSGSRLTTLRHTIIDAEGEIEKHLLMLLDGTHDRRALQAALLPLARGLDGNLDEQVFAEQVERNLQKVAALGLLIS